MFGEDENPEVQNVTESDSNYIAYITPKISSDSSYFFESFDDKEAFEKRWVRSSAKKDDVDVNNAKYDGAWALQPLEENSLLGDEGLVLKTKAKHAAISAKLSKPFYFREKPFIVQYEVNLQNGQECGGAYIKLLSEGRSLDLEKFNDKTPYTIMFGPDKCGNDFKLHFIFRHSNPLTKDVEEKHSKKPDGKIEQPFKDKKTHLYTLILRPDNTFEILLDHQVVNFGHLLEDFTPPVNPAKEINDGNDIKPQDWDEREKIPDPNSAKPVDWDEDAPKQIFDHFAEKPEGWLDDEPDLIPDPEASKPEDWDDEMDGEWEAPLISNSKCANVAGCGKWKPPMIDNPNYKGKWRASLINNPNYKGKWAPRKIPNPDYYEDLEPFKMTPISAVGIELWSISDGIYFDNFLITDNIEESERVASDTFDLKMAKLGSAEKNIFGRVIEFSNNNPWIYGVYVLLLAIPVVLVFVCCCAEDDKEALRKKTDEPEKDDEEAEIKMSEAPRKEDELENEIEAEEKQIEEDEAEEQIEEDEPEEKVEEKLQSEEEEKSEDEDKSSSRLRKPRRE